MLQTQAQSPVFKLPTIESTSTDRFIRDLDCHVRTVLSEAEDWLPHTYTHTPEGILVTGSQYRLNLAGPRAGLPMFFNARRKTILVDQATISLIRFIPTTPHH